MRKQKRGKVGRQRRYLGRRRKLLLPRRPWNRLSAPLQETRRRALEVLGLMRKGLLLAAAAREVGIDPRTVAKHLGKAVDKHANGKYHAKPIDRISRGMVIYNQGKQLAITVPNSKTASTIGQYFNAIRKYFNTGDSGPLKELENVAVVDSDGNRHRLETDGKKIQAIEAAKEEKDFFGIYNIKG